MHDLHELGIEPPGRCGLLRPPTEDEIRDFERHFGVRLARDYVDFLSAHNGGRPKLNSFKTKSGYLCGIGSFHYLLPEDPLRQDLVHHPNGWEFGNLWAETRELQNMIRRWSREMPTVREVSTDQVVPFAYDTGNAKAFAFDLRYDPHPVCMVIVDDRFRVSILAGSFTEFVDQLYEDDALRARRTKKRPPTIRLIRKTDDTEFAYDAALALIRALPDVIIRPKDTVPPASGARLLAGGRPVQLPEAMVRNLDEMAASGKCFDFSWKGFPALSGTVYKEMVFFSVVDDEVATLDLVKSWADKLDGRVVTH
jgi:hypothetical protein